MNTRARPVSVGAWRAIERAVAARDFGVAAARKTGRNPRFPYVPVVRRTDPETGRTFDAQILARAFEHRAAALAFAERHLALARARTRESLADRRYRALREDYGLPRELEELEELER